MKIGKDGKYNLFVCGWPENAPKGHMYWPKSTVFHAVADNSFGPYKVKGEIGLGHNPEIFQLKDGRYIIYVYKAYYLSESLNGAWEKKTFDFNPRAREIIEGLSNVTFAQREDGSYLAVCSTLLSPGFFLLSSLVCRIFLINKALSYLLAV